MTDSKEKYILMCEKAHQIQDGWLPKIGDAIYNNIIKQREYLETNIINSPLKDAVVSNSIWLPNLEDLITMVSKNNVGETHFGSTHRFINVIDSRSIGPIQQDDCSNIPVLMLRFVMLDVFDAIWNGKNWVGNWGDYD